MAVMGRDLDNDRHHTEQNRTKKTATQRRYGRKKAVDEEGERRGEDE